MKHDGAYSGDQGKHPYPCQTNKNSKKNFKIWSFWEYSNNFPTILHGGDLSVQVQVIVLPVAQLFSVYFCILPSWCHATWNIVSAHSSSPPPLETAEANDRQAYAEWKQSISILIEISRGSVVHIGKFREMLSLNFGLQKMPEKYFDFFLVQVFYIKLHQNKTTFAFLFEDGAIFYPTPKSLEEINLNDSCHQ